MCVKKEYLYDLFQSIKHKGYKLSEDEVSSLLKIVKGEYNQEIFEIALSCLSYGSSYVEEQEPLLFKMLLEKDLDFYDIGEVFDCIRITSSAKFYVEEIIEYSKFENWNFDEFEANSNAVHVLGNYIFQSKNKELYNILLDEFNLAYNKLKEGISDEEQDDFLFLIQRYLSAINFSIEGTKSYTRKSVSLTDLTDNKISIPSWKD